MVFVFATIFDNFPWFCKVKTFKHLKADNNKLCRWASFRFPNSCQYCNIRIKQYRNWSQIKISWSICKTMCYYITNSVIQRVITDIRFMTNLPVYIAGLWMHSSILKCVLLQNFTNAKNVTKIIYTINWIINLCCRRILHSCRMFFHGTNIDYIIIFPKYSIG